MIAHMRTCIHRTETGFESESSSAFTPIAPGRLSRLAAILDAALLRLIPLGYEDDTGFHYGVEPLPQADA